MKRILVIFLLTIIFINLSYQLNEEMATTNLKNSEDKKQKLIKCKVCQEMFEFNFNFDEFLKSNKIQNIKKTFGLIEENKTDLETYFSSDNMEFITKEISMQYFFKGTESQFDEATAKNKDCKLKKVGVEETCDKQKFESCEKVLSYEEGICVNYKKTFAEIFDSIKAKLFQNKSHNSNINSSLNDLLMKANLDRKKTHNTAITKTSNDFAIQKFNFKQKNLQHQQMDAFDSSDNLASQFENISLIELNKENLNNNLSNNRGRTWTPPKPVLLDNFQTNIGEQLKDISALASQITNLETKLKILKQELANKLEIAQTSYSAVQQTLSQISKIVNNPVLPTISTEPVHEDDWDEHSKPKFLNN